MDIQRHGDRDKGVIDSSLLPPAGSDLFLQRSFLHFLSCSVAAVSFPRYHQSLRPFQFFLVPKSRKNNKTSESVRCFCLSSLLKKLTHSAAVISNSSCLSFVFGSRKYSISNKIPDTKGCLKCCVGESSIASHHAPHTCVY